MEHPHEIVEEEELSLELLELGLLRKGSILQNCEHEVSVLICNSLTCYSYHELPETGHCLGLMADKEAAQACEYCRDSASKLSIMHLQLFKEGLRNF